MSRRRLKRESQPDMVGGQQLADFPEPPTVQFEILVIRYVVAVRLDGRRADGRPERCRGLGDLLQLDQTRAIRDVRRLPINGQPKFANPHAGAGDIAASAIQPAGPRSFNDVRHVEIEPAKAIGQGQFDQLALAAGDAQRRSIEVLVHARIPSLERTSMANRACSPSGGDVDRDIGRSCFTGAAPLVKSTMSVIFLQVF